MHITRTNSNINNGNDVSFSARRSVLAERGITIRSRIPGGTHSKPPAKVRIPVKKSAAIVNRMLEYPLNSASIWLASVKGREKVSPMGKIVADIFATHLMNLHNAGVNLKKVLTNKSFLQLCEIRHDATSRFRKLHK
jgi:hypothetical protein